MWGYMGELQKNPKGVGGSEEGEEPDVESQYVPTPDNQKGIELAQGGCLEERRGISMSTEGLGEMMLSRIVIRPAILLKV